MGEWFPIKKAFPMCAYQGINSLRYGIYGFKIYNLAHIRNASFAVLIIYKLVLIL